MFGESGRLARSWLPYALGSGRPYQSYGAGTHSQPRSSGQSTGAPSGATTAGRCTPGTAASRTCCPSLVVRTAPVLIRPNTRWANTDASTRDALPLYLVTAPYHRAIAEPA